MGGTYYTLETGALKVMEDFFVYANIFSVKNTTDNTDLFEKILSIILFTTVANVALIPSLIPENIFPPVENTFLTFSHAQPNIYIYYTNSLYFSI